MEKKRPSTGEVGMTRLCTCDQAREEISLPHTEECKFRLWWEAMEDRAELDSEQANSHDATWVFLNLK